MGKVMISTVYEGQVVPKAVHKLGPDKLILLNADDRQDTRKKAIKKLREQYKGIMDVETVDVSAYGLVEIASAVASAIDSEAGNEVYVHITESRKIQSIGAMYGAFMRKQKVEGVYYIVEETGEMLQLPMLDLKINDTKRRMLEEIGKGNTNAKELAGKLGVHLSLIYANFKEMQKEGLLTEALNITEAGRLRVV